MLRDEVAAAADPSNRETALSAFDALVEQPTVRAEALKVVQRYLRRVAAYSRGIDGDWGESSEQSYLRLFPSSLQHLTRLADLAVLARDSAGAVGIAHAIAAGISRDEWLQQDSTEAVYRPLAEDADPGDGWGDEADLGAVDDAPADVPAAFHFVAFRPEMSRAPNLPFAAPSPEAEPYIDVDPSAPPEVYGPSAPLEDGSGIGKTVAIGVGVVAAALLGAWMLRRSRKPRMAGFPVRSSQYRVPRKARHALPPARRGRVRR